MATPLPKDCEQIEHFVADFLALAVGLALAYPNPGFRPYIEPERQELMNACRVLMDVLASEERAAIRTAIAVRRNSLRAPAL